MGDVEDALVRRIEAAFSDAEYPGDDRLTDSTYGEEPAALVAEFRGKTDWRTLPAEFLDQAPNGSGSALAFLSDAALRFYLPAYLRADVLGELSLVSPEVRLCWSLTPQSERQRVADVWGGGTMGERARRCFDQLDPGQVEVVIAYLKWKLDRLGFEDPAITQALDHYWLERTHDVR
jgi:hypothetical protein